MWAGGRLQFLQPLRVGTKGRRESTISALVEKEGRTGKLLFVPVTQEYIHGDALCISEEQDIVYREPSPPTLERLVAASQRPSAETVLPDPIILFRFSSGTLNVNTTHPRTP